MVPDSMKHRQALSLGDSDLDVVRSCFFRDLLEIILKQFKQSFQ